MNTPNHPQTPAHQHNFYPNVPPPLPPATATPSFGQFTAHANNADFADFGITEDAEKAFPMECLPAGLGNIIQELSRSLRVPQELVAADAIGVLSAGIGAGLEIETDIACLRGNLFILGIAASGVGKGLLSKILHEPLHACEAEWRSHWRTNDLPKAQATKRSLESRLNVLEKESGKATESTERERIQNEMSRLEFQLDAANAAMTEPQMIVGDITREKLAIALSHGCKECIVSISSEARGIINVLSGRYNKMSDEDIYLAAFSGDHCRIDRVNRPSVQLLRPCLTLIWLFQPDKLDEMLENPSLMESGFLPRCLMVRSETKIQLVPEQPPTMNQSIVQGWRDLILVVVKAFHWSPQTQIVKVDPMAAKMVRDFDNSIRNEINNGHKYTRIESFCLRWVEILWRLMLVRHVAMHGQAAAQQSITAQDAEQTIKLMKWFIQQQLDILSSVQEQKTNKRLNQLVNILGIQPNGTTLRDMKRRHGFRQEELQQLCAQHPDTIRIEQAPNAGSGRPSMIIRLIQGAT